MDFFSIFRAGLGWFRITTWFGDIIPLGGGVVRGSGDAGTTKTSLGGGEQGSDENTEVESSLATDMSCIELVSSVHDIDDVDTADVGAEMGVDINIAADDDENAFAFVDSLLFGGFG